MLILINNNLGHFIPVRFIPNNKITKNDKLLLVFDALVLSAVSGKMPLFGKIIHGIEQRTIKIKLSGLINTTKMIISRIANQQTSPIPPQLILNRHCTECEFQAYCRQEAIKKDDLSLLPNITEKERKLLQSKGIFTVSQLSFTFRLRRKSKILLSKPDRFSSALKALTIRENKIHIAGKPELNITGTPVFLDVEGIPDQNFYYLIGLYFKCDDSYVQYSFWAEDLDQEQEICESFLQILKTIENPQLIYYGSYEKIFLKRVKERYSQSQENSSFLYCLITRAINILSIIYAQIYFPTYSNGLKDIAQYLGFKWSDSEASGFNALIWRQEWEFSGNPKIKQKLITYNAEDCQALEKVVETIKFLCQKNDGATNALDGEIVHTELLKREYPQQFGKINFNMPELELINRAAYWDYQRDKIYVRSHKHLKVRSQKSVKILKSALPVNKVLILRNSCKALYELSLRRYLLSK